ncbi:unnamed protein product, partial [Polarella glacialis]
AALAREAFFEGADSLAPLPSESDGGSSSSRSVPRPSSPGLEEAASVKLENRRLREEIRSMCGTIQVQSGQLSQLWAETTQLNAQGGSTQVSPKKKGGGLLGGAGLSPFGPGSKLAELSRQERAPHAKPARWPDHWLGWLPTENRLPLFSPSLTPLPAQPQHARQQEERCGLSPCMRSLMEPRWRVWRLRLVPVWGEVGSAREAGMLGYPAFFAGRELDVPQDEHDFMPLPRVTANATSTPLRRGRPRGVPAYYEPSPHAVSPADSMLSEPSGELVILSGGFHDAGDVACGLILSADPESPRMFGADGHPDVWGSHAHLGGRRKPTTSPRHHSRRQKQAGLSTGASGTAHVPSPTKDPKSPGSPASAQKQRALRPTLPHADSFHSDDDLVFGDETPVNKQRPRVVAEGSHAKPKDSASSSSAAAAAPEMQASERAQGQGQGQGQAQEAAQEARQQQQQQQQQQQATKNDTALEKPAAEPEALARTGLGGGQSLQHRQSSSSVVEQPTAVGRRGSAAPKVVAAKAQGNSPRGSTATSPPVPASGAPVPAP